MASIATNTNINGMNRKQLQKLAREVGVSSVHSVATTTPALITAIKAK